MNILFNINNFLHFGVSLFLMITVTATIIYTTEYKYSTIIYLSISANLVFFIGMMKEVYDNVFKSPAQFDTLTDLLANTFGIVIGVIFILIIIKETDR